MVKKDTTKGQTMTNAITEMKIRYMSRVQYNGETAHYKGKYDFAGNHVLRTASGHDVVVSRDEFQVS